MTILYFHFIYLFGFNLFFIPSICFFKPSICLFEPLYLLIYSFLFRFHVSCFFFQHVDK
eukprot:UN22419